MNVFCFLLDIRQCIKDQPLINDIRTRGWNVATLMVIAANARVTTHIPSMKALETKFKLPAMKIKSTFKQININAIQHAHSILIHKRRIENKPPS